MRSRFEYEETLPHEMLSGHLNYVISFFYELYTSRPKRYIFIALLIAIVLFLTPTQRSAVKHTQRSVTPTGCAKAAVAADSDTCSDIGRDILERGGSAVDAAIAALLCVSVINPHSMGIGGGAVFTIYNASNGKVEIINARETAPMRATENMFDNKSKETNPGLLIAVPGELRGYEMAHKRYGKRLWEELFEPSRKLASEGFKMGKALANATREEKAKIQNKPGFCEVFCDSNNNLLKENDIIKFPKLAETYRIIAAEKADAFYNGSLTEGILHNITNAGGIITREDLQSYAPVLTEYALNFTVGKYIFLAPGAPFGGPVLALIMKILLGKGTADSPGFKLSNQSVTTTENKTLTYHRIIEAFRFAEAQKQNLADPLYENITEFVKYMTSDSFADRIRSKIKDDIKQTSYDVQGIKIIPDDHGTAHLSVIDKDGNAVAVTSSINNYFGSGVMSSSTGIIFNDQMSDYIDPDMKSTPNKIKPGKRPLSSMCPTIILDKESKKVKMVVGGAGGTNITTSVAQVILNSLFFDYDLLRAVAEPRVQITSNTTHVEKGFDKTVIENLEKMNHMICNYTAKSVVQAIGWEGDKICALSDPRNGISYPRICGNEMLSTSSVNRLSVDSYKIVCLGVSWMLFNKASN